MKKLFTILLFGVLTTNTYAQSPDFKTGISFSYNWTQNTNDLSLTWDFFNVGGGTNTTFTIAYIASTDLTVDNGDYLLDYVTSAGAVASAFATINFTTQLAPNALPSAVYNLIVFIDYGNNVSESNETNNIVKFGTFNFVNQSVGIGKNTLAGVNLQVYPNPAAEKLFVKVNSQQQIKDANYAIYNLTGQKVLSHNIDMTGFSSENEIALSGLPSGIYFLSLRSGDAVLETKKVMVK